MEYKMPMWDQEEAVEIKPEMKFASNCPCVNTACSRHGFCDVCKEFHTHMDHLSTCMRRQPPEPL